MASNKVTRRTFIAGALGSGVAGAVGLRATSYTPLQGAIPRRRLGRTGWQVSILGFGGFPISRTSLKQATATINAAIDNGVNYLDTASTYGDSEIKMGAVLKTRRSEVYVATKVLKRDRAAAREELDRSFRQLGVDVIDLVQIHAVNRMSDLEAVTRTGGSLEVVEEARKAGKVRFVGITGHRRADVLAVALERYPFATVLFPSSPADAQLHDFEPLMFPLCKRKDVGIILMKTLAYGHLVGSIQLADVLRWAWSREGVATAIVGMENESELQQALSAAKNFTPVSESEHKTMSAAARPIANTGILWWKR